MPRHLEIAIEQIGKLHDGPDVPRLAGEIGAVEQPAYWQEAGPDTPWCGVFVSWCLMKAGIPVGGPRNGVGPMYVNWWLGFGAPVTISQRQPGDIAIYLDNPHHVTFVGDQGDYVGGNQSDGVTRAHYRTPDAVRRPPTLGTQPQPVDFPNSGKGSWYSQFNGKYRWVDTGDAPNSNSLGVPDDAQGVAFYNNATLGLWFEVQAPNGVRAIVQQTDIGPAPSTGRQIDISAAIGELLGYTPTDFPTDGTFHWRPIAPPAAVASLSKKQQAVAYRDIRKGKPMADTEPTMPSLPPPAPSMNGDFLNRLLAYAQQDPASLQRFVNFALFMATGKMPTTDPSAPPPAAGTAPTLPKWGFGTGILGTLLSSVLMQQGTIPPAGGTGSTLSGLLSVALPLALTVFGAGGGPAAILAKIAPSVFAALTAKK